MEPLCISVHWFSLVLNTLTTFNKMNDQVVDVLLRRRSVAHC
jgi:hypothetical protein